MRFRQEGAWRCKKKKLNKDKCQNQSNRNCFTLKLFCINSLNFTNKVIYVALPHLTKSNRRCIKNVGTNKYVLNNDRRGMLHFLTQNLKSRTFTDILSNFCYEIYTHTYWRNTL